jgi:hypothetical protein
MARAGGLGLSADLGQVPAAPGTGWEGLCHGETPGRILLSCRAERLAALRDRLAGVPHAVLGAFTAGGRLEVSMGAAALLSAPVDELARAWKREGGEG